MVNKYPQLTHHINQLLELARDEVESGESESNEVELARTSIEELFEDHDLPRVKVF